MPANQATRYRRQESFQPHMADGLILARHPENIPHACTLFRV